VTHARARPLACRLLGRSSVEPCLKPPRLHEHRNPPVCRASPRTAEDVACIPSPSTTNKLGSRHLSKLRAFVAGTLLLAAVPAWCSGPESPVAFQAPWWGPESSVLYAGFYGIRGPQKWEDAVAGLEFRGGPFWWQLRLMAGALAASDGNFFVYAGLLADVPVANFLHFILSFAPGLGASGTDHQLGIPLDFRSTAEISVRLTAETRLGISFSHISNGKLASPNPGVETLSLTLTVLALPY